MSTMKVFRASKESTNYICPNGKPLVFRNFLFATDVPYDINCLQGEIDQGHPMFSYEGEKDSAEVMPGNLFEELVQKEVLKRMAQTNPDNQLGNYVPGPLMAANSTNVAEAAGGGSGAQLAALKAKLGINALNNPPLLAQNPVPTIADTPNPAQGLLDSQVDSSVPVVKPVSSDVKLPE